MAGGTHTGKDGAGRGTGRRTRTHFGRLHNFDFRPGDRGRRIRPMVFSRPATNAASPGGRPLRPWSRNCVNSFDISIANRRRNPVVGRSLAASHRAGRVCLVDAVGLHPTPETASAASKPEQQRILRMAEERTATSIRATVRPGRSCGPVRPGVAAGWRVACCWPSLRWPAPRSLESGRRPFRPVVPAG
jgi:hypothetical protein